MFGVCGATRGKLFPDQPRFARTIPQHYRGNFRPKAAGKLDLGLEFRRPAQFDEDIQQFAAIAAHHRLHLAMQTAIRAARYFRAVLAIRTLEVIRPAHESE